MDIILRYGKMGTSSVDSAVVQKLRKHEQTGRPLGSENFVVKLERIPDRMSRPKKAGRKPQKSIQKMGAERGK